MSLHELKTWPDPFTAILDGRKRYEVRKADRMFAEGDTLRLREWNEQDRSRPYGYTGREATVRVTYITPPGAFGLPGDLCVMSIAPAPASPAPSEGRVCQGCGQDRGNHLVFCSRACGCQESYPQLVSGRVSHGPGCCLAPAPSEEAPGPCGICGGTLEVRRRVQLADKSGWGPWEVVPCWAKVHAPGAPSSEAGTRGEGGRDA